MGRWIVLMLLLVLALGFAGRQDELDSSRYETVRAEILLSAPTWAVTE